MFEAVKDSPLLVGAGPRQIVDACLSAVIEYYLDHLGREPFFEELVCLFGEALVAAHRDYPNVVRVIPVIAGEEVRFDVNPS